MNIIAIIASQIVGQVSLQGVQQAQSQLTGMGTSTKSAQADLVQLQSVANEVSNVVQNRFAVALRDSQGSLQALASQASNAGLDTSKLSELQAKAAVAADNLAVAQDRAAMALQKAANITIDAASSEDQIVAAQNQASLAADKVVVAENAAAAAMGKVSLEASTLSNAVMASSEKTSIFSGMMGRVHEASSGFFGGLKVGVGGLLEFGSKVGMTVLGVQMMASMFMGAADAAGKMIGDFQAQMTKLVTTAGESANNIKGVGSGILAMAGPTGTAVKDLGDAMYWVESGGFHGAAGLNVLKIAAMGAKAEQADVTGVTKVLTSALATYRDTGITAAQAMNTLIAATGQGKMTLNDLSGAVSNVLPVSAKFGISLADTTAGLATMTMQGDDAASAATHLRQIILALEAPASKGADALKSIGLSSQVVSDEMRKSLPGAIEMITTALGKKFPEGSSAYNEALKDISGGNKQMLALLETSGGQLQVFKDNVTAVTEAVKKGGAGIMGWDLVQQNFNFRMDQSKAAVGALAVKIGTELAPAATQLLGFFTDKTMPALNRFSDWFSSVGIPALKHFPAAVSEFFAPLTTAIGWLDNFVGHGQAAIPILAGIGGVITSILVPAIIAALPPLAALAIEVVAATWPFVAIAVAVGALTAVFLHFYNTSADFRNVIASIGEAMKGVWAFLVDTFTPVWIQLQDVWKNQMQPAASQLMDTFKQMQPELKVVAEILGGVLLYQIGVLVADIGFLVGALSGIWKGAAEMIGGYVQIFAGYVQVIVGFISLIVDLFTGKFSKLGPDLKVILGGVGEIFTGFGNVLKGIVDGIVGGVTGGFKGMATSVVGYLNDIVHGVDNKTKDAAIAAQIHTAEMRDKSVANAQKMNEEYQTNLINMRNGIEEQLKQATDATQRHTLEMKLAAVNNSLEMAQASGREFVSMRYKSQEQLDLMKQGVDTSLMSAADKAKYHSLNMKDFYLGGVIAMDDQTIQRVDHMRLGILDELSRTSDGAKKHALEIQLTEVTKAEDTAKKVKDVHVQQRKDTESEMDKLKTSISNNSKSVVSDIQKWFGGIGQWFSDRWKEAWAGTTAFFGGIGKWFGDRWHDTQNVFAGIGGWFHDRWQEAWAGTTAFFGGIGAWFHDRWVDVQGVFAGIGKWFGDRWNEVMNTTKPFRDYMGAVFQTIWNILVALWGKVSTWFHDRFTEAYNKVVEVFGPIGQWFQDRWKDVVKIFQVVGGWFHDRFTEAWDAVVGAFQFLGKWFSDRWEDTKKVFAGVGMWFHDRFFEAWGFIVAVFTPIGKWFSDRWVDVQNIFKVVGGWFHDRFQEAWNGIVTFFAPIGKWFGDRWHEVLGGIDTFKKSVSDKFNEIKNDTANIFHGMINLIIDQLNNGISGIENFINFFGKGLDDIAKSLGTQGTIPMVHLSRIPHYATGTDDHPGGLAVLGEHGRELVSLPKGSKVAPNDITESLLAMLGGTGKIPGYASGIGDLGAQIAGWISGGAKNILDHVLSALNIHAPNLGPMNNIATGMFDKVKSWALDWVTKLMPKFDFGTGGAGGGHAVTVPGNLQSWILAAMGLTGVPANWAGPLGTIAMFESGGNPNAINLTDSNAIAGHPSQGIMQTIPSTFAAHALTGHTNINNPIDNIAAAIGYILGRYGTVFNVPGIVNMSHGGNYIGYANGGVIDEPIAGMGLRTGTKYSFGERGKELVTPYIPDGVNLAQGLQPSAASAPASDSRPIYLQIDGRTFARLYMPYHVETVRNKVGVNF